MAATNETSHPERNKGWYQEDLTEINQPMRDLLENYSKVPREKVVNHGVDLGLDFSDVAAVRNLVDPMAVISAHTVV
ncbi:hypothetical protein INS49_004088 [Diaporthe citri]|uniref:uncharacterized protein n=1 Tax=Diaporthe citri TaxID=83186 RepID=UPI001C8215EC|nr:uncharacterized protein INS49_004088 [Diaporthe citri]KAG6355007.1 hypothetical protein INS49_004088 [Diaporthe citri]